MVVASIILSCNPSKNDYSKTKTFDAFPLEIAEEHALMTKWEKKEVLKSTLIDDMEQGAKWTVSGIGEMSYTTERAKEGNRSLRFQTSLRDEEHYRKNRSEWNSFDGRQGGNAHVQLLFEDPQDWSEFNRISFWVYVHPTSMPTYCLYLRLECDGADESATSYNGRSHFIQDLKPGKWNHVLFEMPHLQRDKVTSLRINQMLTGHHPEEEGIVAYDIDLLEIQQVDVDYYNGWEVAKGKFAFSHIGYQSNESKIAMAGEGMDDNFQLIDSKTNTVVFSGAVSTIHNQQGDFRLLDFTEYQQDCNYRLRSGSMESDPFPINDDIWILPIFSSMNFFFCQRCGYHVPGVHLECHKDWQGFKGDTKKIINGGWHDAGDLSQGSWRTAMSTLSMMMNLDGIRDQEEFTELATLIRTEIAWGLEWLLKTRFGDGYHMSFSVMRIYTDNQVGTLDDVVTPAQHVPWENFLAAAVQSKAALLLKETHPELAEKSRTAAIEDWEAAVNSRDNWQEADYREAAWGATSSVLLKHLTNDETYDTHAIKFGELLVKCQEQKFLDGIPITGYFYTGTDRKQVIHNYHAAFEEAPLIALATLCREYPNHEDWMNWYSAIVLHSEYFMKRGSQIAAPYNLLPNSVWKKSEILQIDEEKRRSDMLRQFADGTTLNEDYVLRTFPIYRDNLFHGNTNIHMSSTWALAEASRTRNDAEGMRLVGQQFRWIFGANPFGQSLMYGVGYDFAPHFAYCLKDLVGALPVGMDCMSGDDPQWSATNDATYKEIWVEPVNRFLGAVAIYNSISKLKSQQMENDIQMQTKIVSESTTPSYLISITGNGKHELEISSFNASSNIDKISFDLNGDTPEQMKLELKVVDEQKPWVIVLTADQDPMLRHEIVGEMIKPSFETL